MRLFFISLAIALICMVRWFAQMQDWELPWLLDWALYIPSVGFGYMVVFFHELGHTVTMWSYGMPAVPAFDFANGGGFSRELMDERSLVLQGLIYVCFAGAAAFLFQAELYPLLGVFGAFWAFHLWMGLTDDRYTEFVNFMGQGGAVLVGCFCILRAALNKTIYEQRPVIERYLNMSWGIFAVLDNLRLTWRIMYDPLTRADYIAGKGGHLANDYVVIADRLNGSLNHVAIFSVIYTVICLAVTAGLFFLLREPPAEEDGAQPVAPVRNFRK